MWNITKAAGRAFYHTLLVLSALACIVCAWYAWKDHNPSKGISFPPQPAPSVGGGNVQTPIDIILSICFGALALALLVVGAMGLWTHPAMISLKDAAEKVFDEIKKRGEGSALYGADMDMASCLKSIAEWAIACDLPIYGVMPPAKNTNLITPDDLRKVHPNRGATCLTSLDGRSVIYENLQVKRSDLKAKMPRLLGMTNHV